MVAQQRALAAAGDVIAEGRDIGTVVFPNADVKVFLVASPESRARRRAIQRAGGDAGTGVEATVSDADYEQILADIVRRDELDSSRDASPLRAAEDAVTIDTSDLILSQVLERVRDMVECRGGER
jgi:cytidylate kinase